MKISDYWLYKNDEEVKVISNGEVRECYVRSRLDYFKEKIYVLHSQSNSWRVGSFREEELFL